jgi:aminomethyltransferase
MLANRAGKLELAARPRQPAAMLKRTALYEAHRQLGARLVEFGGWEMPVQYTSIVDEHLAVRNAAGLFDISHMGEVTVSGARAAAFLNQVLTNDIHKLAPGRGQYTLLCNERGGTIDDLYAYQLGEGVYLLVINAARVAADVPWLQAQATRFSAGGELRLTDASHNYSAVAVQGPRVKEFIDACIPGASHTARRAARVTDLKKNEIGGFTFGDATVLVSRTGYTGEDGFEIVSEDEPIRQVWNQLLEVGRPCGLQPCGLGARDTLRTEMGYPLYGHELDEDTTPLEAGLGRFVALHKGEFIGRAALAEQEAHGVKKQLVAFQMTGKTAPPRPHYPIWAGDRRVGEVTSGTQSPSLGLGIGLGYVPPEFATPDTRIEIEIRGRRAPAVVVPKPVYRKPAS